ncbi:hypothetical protein RND81_05G148400 [Saponaria officinalis]|uniref:Uncharacterized protein n=1 Tax=Saponaria officinalis TaxID=3572 RepID=A0AAW1KZ87_SAPOF
MSSIIIVTIFAVVLTFTPCHYATTASDILAPLLSPAISELCKGVACGKGKCKMSEDNKIMYECECDPGWKQSLFSNVSVPKFLPCVVPNCTLNHSCSEGAAPPQSGNTVSNSSILEPCRWANCGGGECNTKSGFNYACVCNEGYSNLLNNTAFPCFKECSFGGDCSNLGLTLSNTSSTQVSPPSLADSGTNQAKSLQHKASFSAMIALAMSMVPFLYIY